MVGEGWEVVEDEEVDVVVVWKVMVEWSRKKRQQPFRGLIYEQESCWLLDILPP